MKKKTSLLLSALLMFGITTTATSCSFLSGIIGQIVEQAGISINYKSKTLVVGQSFNLMMKVKDLDDTYQEKPFDAGTTFRSTDTSVATVDETGCVTAVGAGSCSIKVNESEYLNFSCSVTVQEKELRGIKIVKMTKQYPLGQPFEFKGIISAQYQLGYSEIVTPTSIDSSNVNVNVRGTYQILITYQDKSVAANIDILPADEIKTEVTKMEQSVDDLELHDYPFEVTALPVAGENVKMLVLPIRFTDSSDYITNFDNVRSDITDTFFAEASQVKTKIGMDSVKSYYQKESRGKLNIQGVVADWYEENHPSTDYYSGGYKDSSNNYHSILDLLNDATDKYFVDHPSENRLDYDYDKDGFLDGIVGIYGSPNYANLDIKKNSMWASVNSNSAQKPNLMKPAVGKHMWASYTFAYPNASIAQTRTGKSHYSSIGREDTGSVSPTYNPGSLKLDAHTYTHETAHMIGIPDYYSYTSSDSYASEATMQTNTRLTHDPYSLLQFNWVDAIIPESSETITIDDIQSGGNVIILTPEWNLNNSPFDEYIVLDLYTPTGLNTFDSLHEYNSTNYRDVGIRVWHVDARLAEFKELATDSEGYSTVVYNKDKITTDATLSRVTKVTDNSPDSPTSDGLEDFDQFAELFLIRNDTSMSFHDTGSRYFLKTDLFKEGDTFSMSKFAAQFAINGKLDSGLNLGWTFTVDSIIKDGSTDKYMATINVTKL